MLSCCTAKISTPRRKPMAKETEETEGPRYFVEELLSDNFWQSRSEKRPLCLHGTAKGLLAKVGMDEIIEALCKGTRSQLCSTSAFRGGEPHLRENVFMAYLDQATLSLAGAEHFLPWLLALCKELQPAFGFVSARLVVDPENSRLRACESDVLLLQLLGDHRLTVTQPLQGLPVSAPRPKGLEATLQAGDVLYVPAGLEGRPSGPAESKPNVYVLITLQSVELSVGFSLCRYLGDLLLEKQKLSADADAFFRSAMTRRTRDDPALQSDLSATVQRHAQELLSKVTAADLRQHFERRIQQMRHEQLESAAEVQALAPEAVVLSRSSIRLAQGVRCRCQAGDTRAQFTRGSDTMTLNIAVTASPLLSRLSDGKSHRVDSLPCEDPVERVCVCNVLMRKGCLELEKFTPPKR